MSSVYVKDLEAQRAEAAGLNQPVAVFGIKGELDGFADAAESMYYLMNYAESAFGFLARIHGDGDYDGHIGLEAIARLCSRALASCGEKEGDLVEKLVKRLRDAEPQKECAA